MVANINSETGIPYGVVNGHTVPYLHEEIFTSGDSTTFAAYKTELADAIRAALAGVVEDRTGKESAARIVAHLDCAELAENILDSGLNDSLEFEEEEYDHTETTPDGKVSYHLGYLGGAPLIWILESPYVAQAPACSPCVPNAGDLDNMGSGAYCYCPPPDAFNSDDDTSTDSYAVTTEIVIGGRTFKVVAKSSAPAAVEETDE